MFFNVALFSNLLLIPAVLAGSSALDASVARRREGRQSQLNNRLEQTPSVVSNTYHSANWAGAIVSKDNGTFSWVTGTFTVPTPSGLTGASAAAWVGIDGDGCSSAILQTVVVFTVSSDGPEYSAWYEWYPGPAYSFSGITISAEDVVRLTVSTSSMTSGKVVVENLTNGECVEQLLNSTNSLCGQNAEWIVEDYSGATGMVPFANFGTVNFTGAVAGRSGEGIYDASEASILQDIEQNGQVLTSTSVSGDTIAIKYVPGELV